MQKEWPKAAFLTLLSLGLLFADCTTVPKEVVVLSYRMGEDLSALQASYLNLVHRFFGTLREERTRYLDEEWTPVFIKDWCLKGRLLDVAKGDIVWSDEAGNFVKPIQGKEKEGLLFTVRSWSLAAVKKIEAKKDALLEPLDDQEAQLVSWVNDAFERFFRGNAVITAHLNSLRKVQEVQDDALAALHLKDLRDKINDALATASDTAITTLEGIKKADGIGQEIKKTIKDGLEK